MRFSILFSAARRVSGLLACLLLTGSVLSVNPAAAQDKPDAGSKDKPDKGGAADKITDKSADASDVAPLTIALDDIGELRGLSPLKLTADELDKMSAIIADAETDYKQKTRYKRRPHPSQSLGRHSRGKEKSPCGNGSRLR